MRHESKYMASREARRLPASVRTVTSSSCSTDGCHEFWAALGYAVDHELIMDGCSFLIYQEGHQVRASLGVLQSHATILHVKSAQQCFPAGGCVSPQAPEGTRPCDRSRGVD